MEELEPINRLERIIAGEDVQPISNLEKFFAKAEGKDVTIPTPITFTEKILSGEDVEYHDNRLALFTAYGLGKDIEVPTVKSRLEGFLVNKRLHN